MYPGQPDLQDMRRAWKYDNRRTAQAKEKLNITTNHCEQKLFDFALVHKPIQFSKMRHQLCQRDELNGMKDQSRASQRSQMKNVNVINQ